VLFAARTDLQIGTIGVIIPLVMGAVVGLFAGYYAGWLDRSSGGSSTW
jgi:peptide/nickel transport system permease protein